jgi:hypothetical protein
MTKIVMIWWVITNAGAITEPVEWDGWKSITECETALESFTHPGLQTRTWKFGIVGYCKEIPK